MLALGQRRALFQFLNNASLRTVPQNTAEIATTAAIQNSSHSSSSAATTAQSTSTSSSAAAIPNDGLTLNHFIKQSRGTTNPTNDYVSSTLNTKSSTGSVFIETYGCQMNINDSEVVQSVLQNAGFSAASSPETADIVLLNTCAIRDNAESKIWQRLGYFKNMKLERKIAAKRRKAAASSVETAPETVVVGVLGCMAERLKIKLLESDRLVDIVAGPDAYRDLPRLINIVDGGVSSEKSRKKRKIINTAVNTNTTNATVRGSTATRREQEEGEEQEHGDSPFAAAINVQLSLDETYADVVPVRPAGAQSVFLSIMRGCNNMCSFCVVPFTRGRERSRPMKSILDEVWMLFDQGVKEITLLGQNVNSYADFSNSTDSTSSNKNEIYNEFDLHYARGFHSVYRPETRQGAIPFAELLDAVADVNPEMRIRFTSPHPKDFSDDVLRVLRSRDNVCKQLHMPAQSGSTAVLERMKRGYTREAYDALVDHVRASLPGVALSTDMIAGFCEETQTEHEESVDLLKKVQYETAFLFAYSEREKTHAARKYQDNVPHEVKIARVTELIDTYRQGIYARAKEEIGRRHLVLVEGISRKSEIQLTGRTDTLKRVVFPECLIPSEYQRSSTTIDSTETNVPRNSTAAVLPQVGDYVAVQVVDAGGGTLQAIPLGRTSIKEFVGIHGSAVPLEYFPKI